MRFSRVGTAGDTSRAQSKQKHVEGLFDGASIICLREAHNMISAHERRQNVPTQHNSTIVEYMRILFIPQLNGHHSVYLLGVQWNSKQHSFQLGCVVLIY